MPTAEAARLEKLIIEKLGELDAVCRNVDEETASIAPPGRWSPKQILSHLIGPDKVGMMSAIKPFLEQDTPLIDITPENPYYSEKRAGMTFGWLREELAREYGSIARFVATLSDEQLRRKARIPMLKESPLGEHLTLGTWINAIAEYHMTFHIDHLKQILRALGKDIQ